MTWVGGMTADENGKLALVDREPVSGRPKGQTLTPWHLDCDSWRNAGGLGAQGWPLDQVGHRGCQRRSCEPWRAGGVGTATVGQKEAAGRVSNECIREA